MIHRRNRDNPSERELAALADGSLPASARARVERAVAASPALQAELRTQRHALEAVRSTASERAPHALRARVELARPARRPRRSGFALAAAGAAALAAAAVLTLGGGPGEAPSVADAAVLAARPPVAAVGDAPGGAATLARPQSAGLRFPYWAGHFGWKAIGSRHDRLRGRPTTTVFYARKGQVVAYTIVSGAPLQAGTATRSVTRDGTALRSLTVHGRRVVTWLRRGHSCVLSGVRTDQATLLRLAAWRSGGKIAY